MRIRWRIATIERAGLSTQSSIAFSPTGRVAVAYYSSVHQALRLALETDSPLWDISTVDTVPGDCQPSLAFRLGQPAISYRVGAGADGGELRYAVYRGGIPAWSIERVAPSAGTSSLAFDPFSQPAISYYEPASRTLRLARSTSPSGWSTQSVVEGQGAGEFNALSFIPSTAPGPERGQPAIAFYDHPSGLVR